MQELCEFNISFPAVTHDHARGLPNQNLHQDFQAAGTSVCKINYAETRISSGALEGINGIPYQQRAAQEACRTTGLHNKKISY
jgi:hypothetical protein